MAVCFLVALGMIPNIKYFREKYNHPYMDEAEALTAKGEEIQIQGTEDHSSHYSIMGFGKFFAFSCIILGITNLFTSLMSGLGLPTVLHMLLTNTFLISSILTLIVVTSFPKFAESLRFGQDIGSFLLLIFMTTMGTGASIIEVLKIAPLIVVAEIVIILFIGGITLIIAKIFKMNLEEALISINASYGGPATATAYVGARGWTRLMIPAVLIGVYGYVIGNFLGILVGNIFL